MALQTTPVLEACYRDVAKALMEELESKYPELWACMDEDDKIDWWCALMRRCRKDGTAVCIHNARIAWSQAAALHVPPTC